jgi:IMP dehydrogenase
METAYTFDDVMFLPKKSDIRSRSEIDLTTQIGALELTLPVISANMADITEANMAANMYELGGLGILHRFMSVRENVNMYLEAFETIANWGDPNPYGIGVSIGVGDEGIKRAIDLYVAGARTFCIDVAHGHHVLMEEMIKNLKDRFDDINLIAGNVATGEGAWDLHQWGADIIKVGVGPGSCCQTRENTGVGVPQLYAIAQAWEWLPNDAFIISDGGIKKTGDIAKALKYADAVMMGGFFSGTSETPGHVYKDMQGSYYKTMAGSASAESKVRSGKDNSFVEGGIRTVPFRGKVKYITKSIKEGLQSSFSYSGCRTHAEFQNNSELIKISGGGKKESKL